MEEILAQNNRLDYGDLLMPEDGWKTSWAIGTTYSVELETFMAIPMALFQGKYLSESTDLKNLRADMLHALQMVKDRIFMFTHQDNIRTGCKKGEMIAQKLLYTYLDESIFNIKTLEHQNFHPKVWVIRYEREIPSKDFKYRLIVSSRNITSATDFDAAVCLECHNTKGTSDNNSLIAMLTELMYTAKSSINGNKTREQKIDTIISQYRSELMKVKFDAPSPFNIDYPVFLPQGFEAKNKEFCSISEFHSSDFNSSLIISPFLDEFSLNNFTRNEGNQKPFLISRPEELNKISKEVLEHYDCWKWEDILESDADIDETQDTRFAISKAMNLHAKIFICQGKVGYDTLEKNNWFIGSSNFTKAGLNKNFEAILLLKSRLENIQTSPDSVLKGLAESKPVLIERFIPDEKDLDEKQNLSDKIRKLKKELSDLDIYTEEIKTEKNLYNIRFKIKELDEWEEFKKRYNWIELDAHLLTRPDKIWKPLTENEITIGNVSCTDFTPFLEIQIHYTEESVNKTEEFLKIIPLRIPQERQREVFLKIIDNEKKLMKYFLFQLDGNLDPWEQTLKFPMNKLNSEKVSENHKENFDDTEPILEKLLIAKSRLPETIDEIRKTLKWIRESNTKQSNPLIHKELERLLNTITR